MTKRIGYSLDNSEPGNVGPVVESALCWFVALKLCRKRVASTTICEHKGSAGAGGNTNHTELNGGSALVGGCLPQNNHRNTPPARRAREFIAYAIVAALVSACSAYQSYRVEVTNIPERAASPGIVEPTPVLETEEYSVYRDNRDARALYVIPTSLLGVVSHDRRYQAISLERLDGNCLFLVANFAPRTGLLEDAATELSTEGTAFSSLSFYPIDTLLVRPATDPREPDVIRTTTITGRPTSSTPFSVLVVVQVAGKENIISFKRLIEMDAGYVLFAHFDVLVNDPSGPQVRTLGMHVLLRDAYVTNHTM